MSLSHISHTISMEVRYEQDNTDYDWKNKYRTIKNCVDNNGNKTQAAMHRGVLYVQYIVISTTVKPVADVIFLTIIRSIDRPPRFGISWLLSAIPAAMTLTSLVPMDYYNPVIPLFSPVPLSTLYNIKYDRLSPKAPACQQPGISLRPGYSPRLTFPLNLSINLLKNLNHHTSNYAPSMETRYAFRSLKTTGHGHFYHYCYIDKFIVAKYTNTMCCQRDLWVLFPFDTAFPYLL